MPFRCKLAELVDFQVAPGYADAIVHQGLETINVPRADPPPWKRSPNNHGTDAVITDKQIAVPSVVPVDTTIRIGNMPTRARILQIGRQYLRWTKHPVPGAALASTTAKMPVLLMPSGSMNRACASSILKSALPAEPASKPVRVISSTSFPPNAMSISNAPLRIKDPWPNKIAETTDPALVADSVQKNARCRPSPWKITSPASIMPNASIVDYAPQFAPPKPSWTPSRV